MDQQTNLPSIGIVSVGKLGNLIPRVVAANIQGILDVPVSIIGEIEIPEETFILERRQYDAGLMLKILEEVSTNHFCILGVTYVDLCIPVFTYVFGEAQLGGRTAIVSTYRLQRGELGETISESVFYERVVKVALHEIGHVFSLYHCENEYCLMRFSSKLGALDSLPILFCDRCLFLLKRLIRS
ncbi:MAG: hypothetical protein N2260_06555 [Syntrophobacterales bacterium]|nr:hypothetical protein [Syntrophobacterales bacterium]